MKSVLLGGLKVFLVNDGGKPLSAPGGRAKFYVAGTSTPATVYSDIDLTEADALGPVVYTDELGYLPAIWLKTDRLYKVRVEQKLPGSPDTWALLWEVDNVGYIDPHESEEPGEETIAVNSVAALKAVDHSAHTEVMVNGYYTAGDWGEPSMFIWDQSSTLSPDGGSVILPNDQEQSEAGRWLQVFRGDILDVRKFGAIPDLTLYADVTSEVVNAVNYSQRNSTRSRPITVGFVAPGKYYFSGNFDFSQYTFTDLSDNSVHPIKWFIGNDVVFVGHDSIFTLSGETICTATESLISGSAQLLVQGGGGIKVDPAWWGNTACIVSDCIVECHNVTYNDKSFTRCVVLSDRAIGVSSGNSVSLTDMSFRQEWFVDTFSWQSLTMSGVTYGPDDCYSADDYIDIKNSQTDAMYGNLDGKTVTGKSLLGGCVLMNASLSGVTLTGASTLRNVSGTVSVYGSGYNCVWEGCNIDFGSSGVSFTDVRIVGGSIVGTGIFAAASVAFDSVNISMQITVTGTLTLYGCTINNTILHSASLIQEDVRDSVFHAQLNIAATVEHSIVNAVWKGNVGYVTNPIDFVNYANIEDSDSAHSYIYEGNTGTFLPSDNILVDVGVTITTGYGINPDYDDGNQMFSTDDFVGMFNWDGNYADVGFFALPESSGKAHHGLGYVEIFRVGKDNFEVSVDWTCHGYGIPEYSTYGDGAQLATPVQFRMNAEHNSDHKWNINTILPSSGRYRNKIAVLQTSFPVTEEGRVFGGYFRIKRT